jgi:hypothetical protein
MTALAQEKVSFSAIRAELIKLFPGIDTN